MFRFESPLWFLLLPVLPLLAWLRRRGRPSIGVPSLARGLPLGRGTVLRTRWLVRALKVLALVVMIVALARPQWGQRESVRLSEGINIVLAVDTSESMAAIDFTHTGRTVTRLEAVKGVVRDFVAGRSGDRIGLVVFGSEAYTQMPLTSDYGAIISVLDRVAIGAAGPSTAVGDAIGIALKRLEDVRSRSNVVILLTDGRSNAGEFEPPVAADLAAKLGVKIYTIGVGRSGPAPFVVDDPLFGKRVVHRQVEIDEDALRAIAEKTGGLYFHAADEAGLASGYATIDRIEKTEVKVKSWDNFDDLYRRFLIPALGLLLLAVVLGSTRYLEVP